MRSTDAVAFAEQVAERVMKPVLGKGVQVWLNDVLGYAEMEKQLLDTRKVIMQRCRGFGAKLHPGKCRFFRIQSCNVKRIFRTSE